MKTILLQMDSVLGTGLAVAAGVFVVIILFLALRMLLLWYWRIDTVVELLKTQVQLLEEIKEQNAQRIINTGSTVEL
jgi:hypothetical protein